MTPGRVNQIIGELRALTTDKDRPQDEVMTLAVAIRLLESQQEEIASLQRTLDDERLDALAAATGHDAFGSDPT